MSNYRKLCNEWTDDKYDVNNRFIDVTYQAPSMKNYPSHCKSWQCDSKNGQCSKTGYPGDPTTYYSKPDCNQSCGGPVDVEKKWQCNSKTGQCTYAPILGKQTGYDTSVECNQSCGGPVQPIGPADGQLGGNCISQGAMGEGLCNQGSCVGGKCVIPGVPTPEYGCCQCTIKGNTMSLYSTSEQCKKNCEYVNFSPCRNNSEGECMYTGYDNKYDGQCLQSKGGACPGGYSKCGGGM